MLCWNKAHRLFQVTWLFLTSRSALFQYSITMLRWNKALCFFVSSHMTIFNQSECFFQRSITTLRWNKALSFLFQVIWLFLTSQSAFFQHSITMLRWNKALSFLFQVTWLFLTSQSAVFQRNITTLRWNKALCFLFQVTWLFLTSQSAFFSVALLCWNLFMTLRPVWKSPKEVSLPMVLDPLSSHSSSILAVGLALAAEL